LLIRATCFRSIDQFHLSLAPDTVLKCHETLPRGSQQGGSFLLHVRAEIPFDEDHAGRARPRGDAQRRKQGLSTEAVAKAGMAYTSKKFLDIGAQVYVDADKVKEANKAL